MEAAFIGGGITGAGVARDAALRGLSTLLLEKRDYSSGVSSKTTRLVHGGLRYLANFEIDLVAESLRERSILRKQAPYLITPMPILIPIYEGDPHGRAAISIGIHLYELLSREKDIPHYFTAGTDRTLALEPHLNRDGLVGSALFYDHQIILPERLVIENIIAARDAGAKVLNYTKAVKIEDTGDTVVVADLDTLAGSAMTARAKVLINAGGPWVDDVRKAGGIDRTKIIYPTKGIHLMAGAVEAAEAGRVGRGQGGGVPRAEAGAVDELAPKATSMRAGKWSSRDGLWICARENPIDCRRMSAI